MGKSFKIEFEKEELLNIDRAARREADIDAGVNNNHHRVHKNKKNYTRKLKYKNSFLDN